ncbi:helix-turn-helix domain-containing protein [Halobacteriovorax sp. HLS]|uniref:helix-turn-helix domain-containing protein n=1 Tax=Halobacteriovorax sp. HLS TaxID=2234000 RepID=UPI000FD7A815|nr:helix-turn-helix transcriptional regulator [Halobacteriovorax sp. HLS]
MKKKLPELNSSISYISRNVKALRAKRNYTQAQLAKLAGLPRTTLTNIESGEGNPSLSNIIKLANSLNVSIDLLVSAPRPSTVLIKEDDLPKEIKGPAFITKILPDTIKDLDIDRVSLKRNETFKGTPHLNGTREYMTVISGEVIVRFNGEKYHLKKNDLLAFPGDVHHSYQNPLSVDSTYMSIIVAG